MTSPATSSMPSSTGSSDHPSTRKRLSRMVAAAAAVSLLCLAATACSSTPKGTADPLVDDSGGPPVATTGYTTPENAIVAWYNALAKGGISAAKAVATPDLALNLDEGAFQGRTKVLKFEIVSTSVDGTDASVNVRETQQGKKATVVTYVLTKGPKGWLVSGFSPSFTATGGSGGPQTEQPAGEP
jgi:hypothetical protein